MLDSNQIKDILPHRQPMSMIDRVLEIKEGEYAIGLKNISVADPIFNGHFPDFHIYPGVLLVESMAQVGAVAILSTEEYKGKYAYFAGIEKAKFKKPVRPGDQLIIESKLIKMRHGLGYAEATCKVDDKIVASAKLSFVIADKLA
ncbi:3-hydroxyacyl-[acyl-carrier-protein] dehydratase FabZ [Atopobacter sp. AH10]|uniref:3-hydroxyacyl-ACP dehydratase FabZ n=1 Tax=Atopobacter sp. AH10 TaxID=2315861 RepID=UPI000EF1B2D7|nr:3-hydroxyacyl-ACP dehydratase FabZ [Atopobacter sp. AH10]RLK63058.1 3-hydroxyacyl-[acyl-carrier-protein] dehydratase FabZ [Atopobacter sp. AH10]